MDGDFLEAVKRHILSRLQLRGRPNITHAVPKAAMVTALRKLHAGKVREDGRVEIPHLDGHASPGADGQERVSEIISFAETGGFGLGEASGGREPSLLFPLLGSSCCLRRLCCLHAPRAFRLRAGPFCGGLALVLRVADPSYRPRPDPRPLCGFSFPETTGKHPALHPCLQELGARASGRASPSRQMRAALALRALAW